MPSNSSEELNPSRSPENFGKFAAGIRSRKDAYGAEGHLRSHMVNLHPHYCKLLTGPKYLPASIYEYSMRSSRVKQSPDGVILAANSPGMVPNKQSKLRDQMALREEGLRDEKTQKLLITLLRTKVTQRSKLHIIKRSHKRKSCKNLSKLAKRTQNRRDFSEPMKLSSSDGRKTYPAPLKSTCSNISKDTKWLLTDKKSGFLTPAALELPRVPVMNDTTPQGDACAGIEVVREQGTGCSEQEWADRHLSDSRTLSNSTGDHVSFYNDYHITVI